MNSLINKYIFIVVGLIGTSSGLTTWLQENKSEIGELISIIAAALNVLAIIYFSWTKIKPEVKKLEAEGDSEIVEAAHNSLEGAKISSDMLKERIDELKNDLDNERKSRKADAEYFRRRITEIEVEARDYRLWAARLTKQLIEAGKVPEPFVSSLDVDPLISDIEDEQKRLEAVKGKREDQVKNVRNNK